MNKIENMNVPFWFIGMFCITNIIIDVLFHKRFDFYTAIALTVLFLDILVYYLLGHYPFKTMSMNEVKEKYPEFYERFYEEHDLYCDEMCKHCDPLNSFCWLGWIYIEAYDPCHYGHKRNENGFIIYKENNNNG